MTGLLHLYVSIGPDLGLEREYIGQAVARLPGSLAWQITYTPAPGEARPPDPKPLQEAHFYLIFLGQDISAPMGWELWSARRAGIQPLAYARDVTRTLAAMDFAARSELSWISYKEAAELLSMVQEALARALVADPARYGLGVPEWQVLSQHLEDLKTAQDEGLAEDRPGSAGKGAVILSPEQAAASGGVLLGKGSAPRKGD